MLGAGRAFKQKIQNPPRAPAVLGAGRAGERRTRSHSRVLPPGTVSKAP